MDSIYRHRQRANLLLASLLPAAAVMALMGFIPQAPVAGRIIAFAVAAVLLLVAWLFNSMTVTVSKRELEIRFGPGLIRKCWALDEFASVGVVANRWYYGWGVHLIPNGWLYNVSGLHAVELKRASGRVLRIGSNEPEALATALREAIGFAEKPEPEAPGAKAQRPEGA